MGPDLCLTPSTRVELDLELAKNQYSLLTFDTCFVMDRNYSDDEWETICPNAE